MANIHCGCYGTLGTVSGPFSHCPPPPADPSCYQNYPFYNGPCPPGPNPPCCKPCRPCGCGPYPPRPFPPCPPYDPTPTTNRCAALLTCGSNFSVSADESVPLTAQLINTDYFSAGDGGLIIRKSGLYMAACAINLPPYQTVDAVFALCLNGEVIEPSAVQVSCAGTTSNCCAVCQCFVQATPNCLLTLVPQSGVSVSTPVEIDNVCSLSVTRVEA